jgi:hypothetical protein
MVKARSSAVSRRDVRSDPAEQARPSGRVTRLRLPEDEIPQRAAGCATSLLSLGLRLTVPMLLAILDACPVEAALTYSLTLVRITQVRTRARALRAECPRARYFSFLLQFIVDDVSDVLRRSNFSSRRRPNGSSQRVLLLHHHRVSRNYHRPRPLLHPALHTSSSRHHQRNHRRPAVSARCT